MSPRLDPATYRLEIGGEVSRRLSLNLQEILELPKRRMQVTLECCGNSPVPEYWAKQMRQVMEKVTGHGIMSNAEWAGVSLSQVLERAGLKPTAKQVVFTGADHGPDETVGDPPEVTYERGLPLEKAMHPDTLLAYEMNGEPLPVMHGYPLRLLVPGWYGMNSIKWLVGINVIDHMFDGFYQTERYMVMNGPGAEHILHLPERDAGEVHYYQPRPRRDRPPRNLSEWPGPPGRARRRSSGLRSAPMAVRPGRRPSFRHGPTIPGIAGNIPGSHPGRALYPDVAGHQQ